MDGLLLGQVRVTGGWQGTGEQHRQRFCTALLVQCARALLPYHHPTRRSESCEHVRGCIEAVMNI